MLKYMLKFLMVIFFMNFMMIKNKMGMFYYNLSFLVSFMMLFVYMFKDLIWVDLFLNMGVEFYSIWLVILSGWIVGLMMMCLNKWDGKLMFMFINLAVLLIMFFLSVDLLTFYLMFEISLIPTFFLIIYWGGNMERLSASYYLMMYMLLISFPLLIYIMKIYLFSLSLKFSLVSMIMYMYDYSLGGFLMIYLAFYIKMPMYIVHIWLPKAHVEAPVYGSMILAGVLLKMGSYGLIRLLEVFIYMSMKFNYLILSLSIIGSVMVSMLCLIQVDMKSLVAYSSVVHMNMMLCALMTMYKLGSLGAYIMMISHGLCSSGMFYMVNLFYERSGSRLLIFNKGMMSKLSSMMLWWFLLCVANFSFPFSLNFFSELMILMVILNWNLCMIIYLMMVCFMSGAYSLYLFSYVQHGVKSYGLLKFNMSLMKEFLVLIMHFYPLLVLMLNLVMLM
uniref:NADH-ubiquinone oxidoreductase chain 4 n=1 Tax=Solenopsis geminata TaxID=121131 RepID=E3VRT9_SOLGE|nr:NADH dehydrogenase subunit 4 [Solenopsis geminata]ADP01778.1 NADH dehydrogenase subunit 4 [Solenopsis geminata]